MLSVVLIECFQVSGSQESPIYCREKVMTLSYYHTHLVTFYEDDILTFLQGTPKILEKCLIRTARDEN
jgi:hypothetical protein